MASPAGDIDWVHLFGNHSLFFWSQTLLLSFGKLSTERNFVRNVTQGGLSAPDLWLIDRLGQAARLS